MSETTQGLFASSTAGTMKTSSLKSLEEHAEDLWVLLHNASSTKVDQPGDCGNAVSSLQAFTEVVSMHGFSTLHTSVQRECTAGCMGQSLVDCDDNVLLFREPELPRESVLFLQSRELVPDCNPEMITVYFHII